MDVGATGNRCGGKRKKKGVQGTKRKRKLLRDHGESVMKARPNLHAYAVISLTCFCSLV